MVIQEPNDTTTLESIMAPFDENERVSVLISREQLIEEKRNEIKKYEETTYAEYLKDPKKYEESTNPSHFKYVALEFPEKLKYNDEQLLKEAQRWYDTINEDGSVIDTYNPDSKWDWYQIGGRWKGSLTIKEGTPPSRYSLGESSWTNKEASFSSLSADVAYVGDIDWQKMREEETERLKEKWDEFHESLESAPSEEILRNIYGIQKNTKYEDYINPFSITVYALLLDGTWYQQTDTSRVGPNTCEIPQDKWKTHVEETLLSLDPETKITIVDCHI